MIVCLQDVTRNTTVGVIVAGDVFVKALDLDMPLTNTKGRYILEIISRTDLIIPNVDNVSTVIDSDIEKEFRTYLSHPRMLSLEYPTGAFPRIVLSVTTNLSPLDDTLSCTGPNQ